MKSYIYCYSIDNGGVWRWRAVECVRVFETVFVLVVESWNIAVNLDGNLLSLLSTQFSDASLYIFQKVQRTSERNLGSFWLVAWKHNHVPKVSQNTKISWRKVIWYTCTSYNECSYEFMYQIAVVMLKVLFLCYCTFRLYITTNLKAGYHDTRRRSEIFSWMPNEVVTEWVTFFVLGFWTVFAVMSRR